MVFKDRAAAGEALASFFKLPPNSVLFPIPRGGVPVAYPIAVKQRLPLDLVVVRKLPLPQNPEAGFGAIAPDGTLLLNPELEGLVPEPVKERIAKEVLSEVARRDAVYRGNAPYPDLTGKVAVVVDDGFASGYTAAVAALFLRKLNPEGVVALAPVCSVRAKKLLDNYFDSVHCLHVSDSLPFAVANFYLNFPDLTDEEVLNYLQRLKQLGLYLPEGK
jgi:predicted phosphoribosyltransferase